MRLVVSMHNGREYGFSDDAAGKVLAHLESQAAKVITAECTDTWMNAGSETFTRPIPVSLVPQYVESWIVNPDV